MKNFLLSLTIGIIFISCTTSKQINNNTKNQNQSSGIIKNRNILDSLLRAASNKKIDSSKPIVAIYYPGKDPCNSGGSATRKSRQERYNVMEKGINKISESNIIYIYKDSSGLYGRNDGFKDWYKDPEKTFEQLFFEQHYPCSSFVVISKNGRYISHFGEFSIELVWKVTKALKK